MSIQEFCLIPKKLVESLNLNKSGQNRKENVYILNKTTSVLPYIKPSEYRIDLKDQLKTILKSKFDKGYSLYLWLKENETNLEYMKNGDLIAPISNLNIINFINDAVSKSKSLTQEQMNKYKLFTNIVNLPEYFIENEKMKEYLYPNSISLNNIPKNRGKKRLPIHNDNDSSGVNFSPINLRSRAKKRKTATGNIKYITTINPVKYKNKKKNRYVKRQWISL